MEGCYAVEGFRPAPGGTVVDAGCALGDFTLLSASSGAKVVAFDPDPENVRHTMELLQANGLEADVRATALGRGTGTVSLGRMGSIMLSSASVEAARPVEVRALDSLDLPHVSLLKIDVEGMEADVLTGAGGLLKRDRPRIIVEVHGAKAAREVGELLRREGYARVHAGPDKIGPDFGFARDEFWAAPDGRIEG